MRSVGRARLGAAIPRSPRVPHRTLRPSVYQFACPSVRPFGLPDAAAVLIVVIMEATKVIAAENESSEFPPETLITTCDMHTAGEPLRIVTSGFPPIRGKTILQKREYAKQYLDQYRKLIMHEPRGHSDMYGAILVEPSNVQMADMAVLFIHNGGYSTMCGHAIIALGRFAVDHGLVERKQPETEVRIECPCGIIKAFVDCSQTGKTGKVRFHSVPSFVLKQGIDVSTQDFGTIKLDISYGGAFYAIVPAKNLGLNIKTSKITDLAYAGKAIMDAIKSQFYICHPTEPALGFLYGTILTDGYNGEVEPSFNVCVFGDGQVDRSPTGSGVVSRMALQFKQGEAGLHDVRTFQGISGGQFTCKIAGIVHLGDAGDHEAVIVEVEGKAFYTGSHKFIIEDDDDILPGLLLRP